MIQIEFTQRDVQDLRHERFHHPDSRVQVRMEALFLRSQGIKNSDIRRLCGISKANFHRYLDAYVSGGIENLKQIEHYRPQSEMNAHRTTIEAAFREQPPATVAEAAARIEALTGISRKPTQVRQFLTSLGMKPRKVGMIPAKADVAAQESFQKKSASPVRRSQCGQAGGVLSGCSAFCLCPVSGDSLVL
jgi:transposase